MTTAEYIFKYLADKGVRHVFLVTGGGAMFLNEALRKEKRLKYVCNLHEQACAIAAEGYARVTGTPGVVSVTTGPGGTNAITGVAGAWLDSIPMLIISGQVKCENCMTFYPELTLRQLGDQELNIIDVVRPITKYAAIIRKPEDIRFELEKAWYLCQNGRPGPVWLDVPLDIQSSLIDESQLYGYVPEQEILPPEVTDTQIVRIVEKIKNAKRPVIVAGNGVRCGKAVSLLREFAEKHNVPFLTSISGIDLIESEHPLFFGRPGILGERAANFIMQNSDFLLVLGTRMGLRVIGYAYETTARAAFKVMVDADAGELQKPTFKPDIPVHADAGDFLKKLLPAVPQDWRSSQDWLDYCRRLKNQYPVVTDEHRSRTDYVSTYAFAELIGKKCAGNAVVVTGNGVAYTSTFQAIPVQKNMRVFANQGCASMGYGLPAAIGAAFAGEGKEVICLTGDGSLQMNIQELQTIKNYDLPLKLFVYNNGGYLSIKLTQKAFFNGNFVGSEAGSGIVLPDLEKLAAAYGLPFRRFRNNAEAEKYLPGVLSHSGPVIVEVMTDPFEVLSPKAASKQLSDGRIVSAPLEDLSPFLPRDEFFANMFIPPVEEE